MKRYRKISMGGARNPGDGSPARRLRGGAPWGPSGPPGGGIDIDYCAFPTCPGNPRGIVSAPALRFCTLLPPPSSPTLSASHRQRQASLLLSACLSRFLFLSVSISLFLFLSASAYLYLSPRLSSPSAVEIKKSTHPWIFSRESVRRFTFTRRCRDCHGDRARSYCLSTKISTALSSKVDRQHIVLRILLHTYR